MHALKYSFLRTTVRKVTFFNTIALGLLTLNFAEAAELAGQEYMPIPANIITHNVPGLPTAVAGRLSRYANTRNATLAGWQGDDLLVYTRFAESTQLHRVGAALAYREQLTFLPEPLGEVIVPEGGAKNTVILSWDVGGSEFDQLFLFDLNTRTSRRVSDGKSLYSYVIWAPDEQSFIYATTARNGRNWDIHWQDLKGNQQALLTTEDGYWFPLDWSADGKRVLIKNRVSVNESSIYELEIATRVMRPLLGAVQSMSIDYAAYDDRGGVFFTSDQGHEFLRLNRLEQTSGEIELITADLDWDVEAFVLSPDADRLLFLVNQGGVSQLNIWDLPSRQRLVLPEIPAGIVTSAVFSPDGRRLGVTINSADTPADTYVLDIPEATLTRWTKSEVGGLNADTFVTPELISFTSFDGLEVPAFVYRPNTPGPHPVVIAIHGGPEAQYRPYFSSTVQAYVNEMGVAVIAPNVRGSRGYGKSYLQLDNGLLRENSVQDIGALLDWIEDQDDLEAGRVALMGGSYGGYMVLACMVHFSDRLAAGIDSIGISNFVTFLENTQAYRQDIRRVEYGDERDPAMREFLERISPLNNVDKMATPLLISQGANDPRVPASESEQMRVALEKKGTPVWYILGKDEGHGFRKKVNRDFDRAARFMFLESYLGRE